MQMTITLTPELAARVHDWGQKQNMPPENLAVELLEEYFDDCDDADKLEALIRCGKIETYPAEMVHKELDSLAVMES